MEIAALTWSTPLARLAPVPPRTSAAPPSHDWPHAAPSVRPPGAAGPAAAPADLLRDLHAQARMARAVAAYQAEQAARQTAARSPCAAQGLGDIDCLMVLQAYRVAMPMRRCRTCRECRPRRNAAARPWARSRGPALPISKYVDKSGSYRQKLRNNLKKRDAACKQPTVAAIWPRRGCAAP